MRESPIQWAWLLPMSFPMHTFFCNPGGCGHNPMIISVSLMCLLFKKVICMTHFVIHSACTSMSGLLLVINICLAIMESKVLLLHLYLWYYVFCVSLQWLGIISHWSDTLLIQTKWIRLHSETFEHVSSRPAIFKLISWWYNVHCPLMAV